MGQLDFVYKDMWYDVADTHGIICYFLMRLFQATVFNFPSYFAKSSPIPTSLQLHCSLHFSFSLLFIFLISKIRTIIFLVVNHNGFL